MSAHDLSSDVGNASMGDDLPGSADKSLKISSASTGWRTRRRGPTWGKSASSGSPGCPASSVAIEFLMDWILPVK